MSAAAPAPYGPLPSARQLAWHERALYAFVHFSPNTFTDKEWGFGDEDPAIYRPTAFDADQIAAAAADAGLRGIVLTCKHHDGFCLWPSRFTEHSVKNSPLRLDVVRATADACGRAGLDFGTYLSPWDRNHAAYGTPTYIDYYRAQLRELMTEYGQIFEVWFDGANGGDGWYGGANERRSIDNRTYYDWPNTWSIVRELQPEACLFSDGGPDIRWVGNESGFAGETCWATINNDGHYPGAARNDVLGGGERPGTHWLPAEVDVSIRPGWFYHAHEDDQVRSAGNLMRIYFESVGRGANLILNLPPDRRGLIHEIDVANLKAWKATRDKLFAVDVAQGAQASTPVGRGRAFAAGHALDGSRQTYWSTPDDVTDAELVLDFPQPAKFNVARLREHLPLGQRIDSFALDRWEGGHWIEFASGTSIGNCRLTCFAPVTTPKIRLRTRGPVCPALRELSLFHGDVPSEVTA
jgi:alpha-L-fucosidase